jgi:two-component system, OmpR family, sensor histidine kinase ArlS
LDLVFIVAKKNYKMNIKTRLSLQFTVVVLGILVFFSMLVFYFSYTSQRSKFRDNLLEKAQNTAILSINIVEIDSTLLKTIHQSTRSFVAEEIAITNESNKLLYSNNTKLLTEENIISHTYNSRVAYFSIGNKDGVSYRHQLNNQSYHVFVLAIDTYRAENIRDLKIVLLWSILISVWLSVTASYFFSKSAIKPISNIITKVKEINSARLSNRLDEGKRQDEIEQLAITFNRMLSDLEKAFKSQDEFVSNASHELRTPLAIMIAESDYILSRSRNLEDYTHHIRGLIDDLRKMNTLINSLLELAHLSDYNSIEMSELRIDELIFNSIQATKVKYPGRKILPKIEYSENENDLIVFGNQGLLDIALKNLLENACKFSNDDVEAKISLVDAEIVVCISDHGIGIPEDQINAIFNPFNRSTNVKYIGGFGIGLSIVSRIMKLHSIEIKVSSIVGQGTSFELVFPKIPLIEV